MADNRPQINFGDAQRQDTVEEAALRRETEDRARLQSAVSEGRLTMSNFLPRSAGDIRPERGLLTPPGTYTGVTPELQQAEQVLTMANFQRERDSFGENVMEGILQSGDRVAASPMSETMVEQFFENLGMSYGVKQGALKLSNMLTYNPRRAGTQGFRNKFKTFVDDLATYTQTNRAGYYAQGTILPTVLQETGAQVALKINPDSDTARFIGEFAGGFLEIGASATKQAAMQIGPINTVATRITDMADKARQAVDNMRSGTPLFKPEKRGRRFFSKVGLTDESPLVADIKASREEELLEGASEIMTPSMRADNVELMQIEQSIIDHAKDTKLTNETARKIQSLNEIVVKGFDDFTNTSAASYGQYMQNLGYYYDAQFQGLMEVSARESQDLINKIGSPELREANANRIVFSRIDDNLHAARGTETDLYNDIKKLGQRTEVETLSDGTEKVTKIEPKISFDSAPFLQTYTRIRREANQVERMGYKLPEIPSLTKKYGTNVPVIGDNITIDESMSILKELRGISRDARTGDRVDYQVAHWADQMVEALGETMQKELELHAPEVQNAVNEAVTFSKSFNEVFRNDTIANMYLRNSAGQPVNAPTEALNTARMFDQKGARENLEQIMTASGLQPKTPPGETPKFDFSAGEQDPAVVKAVEDYILFNMMDQDNFNVAAAESFLNGNQEILEGLPGLKSRLAQAVETRDMGKLREDAITAAFEPAMTHANIFLNQNVRNAVSTIIDSPNPTRDMAFSIRAAKEDESGNALLGLKQAFVDYILLNSYGSTTTVDTLKPVVSGSKMNNLMSQPHVESLMNQLFDADELSHFNKIRFTALRTEKRQFIDINATSPIDSDLASKLFSGIVAGSGALIGGSAGSMSMGGSLMLANRVSRAFEETFKDSVNDPTIRYLRDAIFDEQKLDTLFDVDEVGRMTEEAAKSWAGWQYQTLVRYGAKPYIYNPLIHGLNPLDEKGEEERP